VAACDGQPPARRRRKAAAPSQAAAGSKAGGTVPLRAALRDGRARLEAAAAKHAPGRGGDFEHDPPGRFVQGGAPGLGKRA
jgi:hypothetical protein